MKIDRELDRETKGAANLTQPVHRQLDRFKRLVDVAVVVGPACVTHARDEAQEAPSCLHQLARPLDAGRTVEHTGRGKALHPLTAGAAQELVDRHAEPFPEDVPQRDIDRRERGGSDLATLEVRAAIHRLPEVLDAARVFADEEAAEMLQHPLHGELTTGDAPLADAGDPLVRLDRDDELVTVSDSYR